MEEVGLMRLPPLYYLNNKNGNIFLTCSFIMCYLCLYILHSFKLDIEGCSTFRDKTFFCMQICMETDFQAGIIEFGKRSGGDYEWKTTRTKKNVVSVIYYHLFDCCNDEKMHQYFQFLPSNSTRRQYYFSPK